MSGRANEGANFVPVRGIGDARINLPVFTRPEFEVDQSIPRRWTWRDRGVLGPPSDQHLWETCVSHAFSGQHADVRRIAGRNVRCDPELFHQCAMGLNCSSGVPSLQKAIETYRARGLPLAGSGFTVGGACPLVPRVDPPLGAFGMSSADDVKHAIGLRGPVIVVAALEQALVDLRGWAIHHDTGAAPAIASHAMVLVGYDDDAGCWEVRNSGGTDWGVNGIGRIAYGSARIQSGPEFPVFQFA